MKNLPAYLLPRMLTAAFVALLGALSTSAQVTWNGTVATTSNWNDSTKWVGGSVPSGSGVSVLFSKDFTTTATFVDLQAGNYTVGTLTMTDSGGGNAGKFNLQNGTLTLAAAGTPVINYTTGGQFDNFINVTLAGSQGFEKTGGGIIQIGRTYNSSGYTGVTKITAGGVRIDGNGALGNQATGSGVELAGGTLYIRTGNTFALDNRATFTDPAGSAKRDITVTGGTSATPTQLQVENNSTVLVSGNLTSNAGTFLRKTDAGTLTLAGTSTMSGVFEAEQGTTNVTGTLNTTAGVIVAKTNPGTAGRTSTLNWSGSGTVAQGNSSFIINDGGLNTTGTLNVTEGSLTIGTGAGDGGRFVIGGKGAGIAAVSGGTLTLSAAKEVSIGSFFQYGGNNGNGTLTLSGGTFEAQGTSAAFFVGYGQTAASAGGAFAGTGTLNLNGGTLLTGRNLTTGPGATGTLNFNGGTLKAGANNSNWVRVTTRLGNAGATIDTNGYDVTITQALEANGTGGLTKTGSGLLTLTATNTYTGATTVTDGTLILNGSTHASSALTVESAGTLGGSGTVNGSATIAGTHSPGNSPGIQTFANGLTYNTGATVNWELSASTATQGDPTPVFDQVIVNGSGLNFAGATTLNLQFNAAGSTVAWGDSFWNSNRSWTIYDNASVSGLGNLSLNTSNWADSSGGLFDTLRPDASFSLALQGSDVVLNYTAIPEPSTYAALLGVLALGIAAWRRRRA
jgi:autotransporter-associated beta strand protein